MESWNQYVWLANMICFRLLHWSQKQMTQGVSKIFQAFLWVSLSHGVSLGLSQHVFCIFFSFVRPESEDLRIDIAVLLESLIMGSFQAHFDASTQD